MRFTNRIVAFLLIAAISVLAGGQAGRAGVHDAHAIEICAESAVIIIYVDAQGREVPATPACDCAACGHCTMPGVALLPQPAAAPAAARLFRRVGVVPVVQTSVPARMVAHQARGPPAPKAMT